MDIRACGGAFKLGNMQRGIMHLDNGHAAWQENWTAVQLPWWWEHAISDHGSAEYVTRGLGVFSLEGNWPVLRKKLKLSWVFLLFWNNISIIDIIYQLSLFSFSVLCIHHYAAVYFTCVQQLLPLNISVEEKDIVPRTVPKSYNLCSKINWLKLI